MKVTVSYERLISTAQYENKRAKVEIVTSELEDDHDIESELEFLNIVAKTSVNDQLGIRTKTVAVRDRDDD